jgi:DNA invertase Pin-like site-specific DNA recombinase
MTLDLLPTITDTGDAAPILAPKAPGILRVIIYSRISKIGKSNSTNTAIQVAECLREIKYLGKDRGVKVIIVAIFQEDDKSASKYSKKPRPLWNRAVELVHGNWVDMVMATEMECLTRRPNEMSVLIDHADPNREGGSGDLREINLTSDDVFDLTTDNGIYRARQSVALSERESNKLSKRARRKQAELAERGSCASGASSAPSASAAKPIAAYSSLEAKNVISRSRMTAADCSGGFRLQSTRKTSNPACISRSVACR